MTIAHGKNSKVRLNGLFIVHHADVCTNRAWSVLLAAKPLTRVHLHFSELIELQKHRQFPIPMTHPMHSWSVDIILYFEISYVVAIVIQ